MSRLTEDRLVRPRSYETDAHQLNAADYDIARVVSAPWLALAAIEVAIEHLSRYSRAIDCPISGAEEAADLLYSARDMLVEGLIR